MYTKEYLNNPLDLNRVLKGDLLQKISLRESISQHLHLIITTHLNENLVEPSFGCSIWEYDFDNTINDIRLRDLIKNSLIQSVVNHENRLRGLEMNVNILQMEINGLIELKRVKKRVEIELNARLVSTNEEFKYFEYFYLGPLSYC